jgi:hypothetical protein
VDECNESGAVGLVHAALLGDAFQGACQAIDYACSSAYIN